MSENDIWKDALGQYAPSQTDGNNNGLSSAKPRVVTGNDDATLGNAESKPSPKPGFDVHERTSGR